MIDGADWIVRYNGLQGQSRRLYVERFRKYLRKNGIHQVSAKPNKQSVIQAISNNQFGIGILSEKAIDLLLK